MSYINITDLTKTYPKSLKNSNDRINVLANFSLYVEQSEFVTILGPNASGKTTLLNIIAGLIKYDGGKVTINDKNPKEAAIGFVFQDYRDSLFPWRTNLDNIAFPLELAGISKSERREKVKQLLKRFNINLSETSYPYQLSGGQAQLVAILRALIKKPEVLLMDEPFNQLDYQTRIFIHDKLLEIWRDTGVTIIFVSHDIDEALLLGDKVVILSKPPDVEILDIIQSKLPRDRFHKIMGSELYFEQKKAVFNVFEKALQ